MNDILDILLKISKNNQNNIGSHGFDHTLEIFNNMSKISFINFTV
jgi:hypothetical protein